MRIVGQAYRSDTGRQRSANEDSFFVSAPVFAVADGMGGAQAGEVASRIAAEAFGSSDRGDLPPEAYLREVAIRANRRIHDLSRRDRERSGMGTTLTAAMLEGDELAIAHVGDSRAYVLRGSELKLLTSDHSLVEELVRRGQLTAEQAAEHPQRSIITRALGPEAEVAVDTLTVSVKPGDVYLLCSDGLTTMVGDERIAELVRSSDTLDAAVDRLIAEANAAGGRDNITVVAFEIAEGEPAGYAEGATLVGPTAEEAGLTAEAVREAAAVHGGAAAPGAGRRRRRRAARALGALVLVALLLAAGVLGARQVYFLGLDDGGRVTLFRGLPYDLPLGIDLYSDVHSSPIRLGSLPPDRRSAAVDHQLRSRGDAVSLLEDLERAAAERRERLRERQEAQRREQRRREAEQRRERREQQQEQQRGEGGG